MVVVWRLLVAAGCRSVKRPVESAKWQSKLIHYNGACDEFDVDVDVEVDHVYKREAPNDNMQLARLGMLGIHARPFECHLGAPIYNGAPHSGIGFVLHVVFLSTSRIV